MRCFASATRSSKVRVSRLGTESGKTGLLCHVCLWIVDVKRIDRVVESVVRANAIIHANEKQLTLHSGDRHADVEQVDARLPASKRFTHVGCYGARLCSGVRREDSIVHSATKLWNHDALAFG